MVDRKPETKLSSGFSSDAAVATEWAQGRRDLEEAELYWLSTVRPDGRPHVTPLIGIWLDGDEVRNVLVMSSSEWPVDALRAALGDVRELRIVVPAVHQSRLQWPTGGSNGRWLAYPELPRDQRFSVRRTA